MYTINHRIVITILLIWTHQSQTSTNHYFMTSGAFLLSKKFKKKIGVKLPQLVVETILQYLHKKLSLEEKKFLLIHTKLYSSSVPTSIPITQQKSPTTIDLHGWTISINNSNAITFYNNQTKLGLPTSLCSCNITGLQYLYPDCHCKGVGITHDPSKKIVVVATNNHKLFLYYYINNTWQLIRRHNITTSSNLEAINPTQLFFEKETHHLYVECTDPSDNHKINIAFDLASLEKVSKKIMLRYGPLQNTLNHIEGKYTNMTEKTHLFNEMLKNVDPELYEHFTLESTNRKSWCRFM